MGPSETPPPPADSSLHAERRDGQLHELQELGEHRQRQLDLPAIDGIEFSPPITFSPPPPRSRSGSLHGGERKKGELKHNDRGTIPGNSGPISSVPNIQGAVGGEDGGSGGRLGSINSIYSSYSSYVSSDRDGGEAVQVGHVERPPGRNLVMQAIPPRSAGSGRPPPPTYAPPRTQDLYNRVRFAEQHEFVYQEEESSSEESPAELAEATGRHSMKTLWVFSCCAFFWYRCLMDEDF